MKARTYIDDIYYLFVNIYYVIILTLSAIILVLHYNSLYVIITSCLLIFVTIVFILFYNRKYIFKDKKFIIKVGFFKKEIKYKDIKKCYITNNHRLSYATSYKRIAIELKNKTIYISPEGMDKVLKLLIDRKAGVK